VSRLAILPLVCAVVTALAGPAVAQELDAGASQVSLVFADVLVGGDRSTAQRFTFTGLSGNVSEAGAAEVRIALDTLGSGVDARDERLRAFLFETGLFGTDESPEATITATVPVEAMQPGSHLVGLPIEISLHGDSAHHTVPVRIGTDEGTVRVTAVEPIVVDAADYALEGGIAQLVGLARLLLIPTSVQVSFSLSFGR